MTARDPDEPFVGDPIPWDRAVTRMMHNASAGGHSSIIRSPSGREVRVTYLRPDDAYGRDIGLPGFVLRGEVWDHRLPPDTRWRPIPDWTDADKILLWQPVSHAYQVNGRCASRLCAQYNHAGGLHLPTRAP